MNTYAIATLVMNGNDYVPAASTLGKSIRLYSSVHTICMVTSDVTMLDELGESFDEVVQVDRLTVSKVPTLLSENMEHIYGDWKHDSLTKWNILQFDAYRKVLFMDADMIVVGHIDELFLLNVPAAMFDIHTNQLYTKKKAYSIPAYIGTKNVYGVPIHGQKIDPSLVGRLRTQSGQFGPSGALVLVQPSKFTYDLFKIEMQQIVDSLPSKVTSIDELVLSLFYHDHGYTWTHIGMEYNVAAYHTYHVFKRKARVIHYITPYKPWMEDEATIIRDHPVHLEPYQLWHRMYQGKYMHETKLPIQDHLVHILTPLLGPRTPGVIERYLPMYEQVFISRHANPVSNYELMETYGDRFLVGYYMWLLLDTPGIIDPNQVSKISSYFQDNERLERVCDYLDLTKYIDMGEDRKITGKVKADVVEALIAAIGISWEKMYKRGDMAMRRFIKKVFDTLFTIHPDKVRSLYEHPKTILKQMAEGLGIPRDRISELTVAKNGDELMVTIRYNDLILGYATISTVGVNKETAESEATRMAYQDAVDRGTLKSLSITM